MDVFLFEGNLSISKIMFMLLLVNGVIGWIWAIVRIALRII